MNSNYPPGHPTGVSRGDVSEIYECEHCFSLWELREVKNCQECGSKICPTCKSTVVRAGCDVCGEPATHIDVDRPVNAAFPYCSRHTMR